MDDRDLDRLFDGARRDLPAPSELSRLRERLKLDAPPSSLPSWRPWAWGAALGVALVLAALSALPPESARTTSTPTAIEAAPSAPPLSREIVTRALETGNEPAPEAAPEATPEVAREAPEARLEVARTPEASASRPSVPLVVEEPGPTEASLVARAAAALRRASLDEARSALREARERYPEGLLREERASLEVQLTLAEDPAAGEAALARFRSAFPGSAHIARLERLLRAASE